MTSIGNRWSEQKAGSPGQEVLWLAASDPPAALATFLRSRGLRLVARDALESPAPLKLLLIEASGSAIVRAPNLTGRRIAVMHPDPGNADALAQALRAKGAEVVALSLNPDSLQRAETLDPDAVIMEASDFSSSCWEIVRALWQHPHLRFATIVLATPELMGQQVSALDVQHLSFAVNEVAKEYERIADDARRLDRFAFELESLGPTRSLRALLAAGRALRVTITSADASIEVDLAEQIIVGAQSPAGAAPTEGLLGVHALNLLLAQRAGRVDVRSVDHPAHTNVMAPLDTAMHMARDTSSAVRPSGVHRPYVEARPAAREQSTEARPAAREEAPSKPKRAGRHDQTLIGVPAVQLDPSLMSAKAKSAAAPSQPPVPAKANASGPTRTLRPSAPEPAPAAARPPPALARRSLPPSAPQKPPATNAYASPASAPTAAPELAATESAPRAKAPAPPVPAEPEVLHVEEQVEPAGVLPAVPASTAPRQEPALNVTASSALDTIKLDAVDADAVRAFRGHSKLRLPKHALWLAAAFSCAFLLVGLFARGEKAKPGSAPLSPAAQLVPQAKAAEPVPEAREPAPAAVAPTPPVEEEVSDEHGGHQNRANARKASLLSNQANAFRRKKMLPTARVRYLEALRVYPDYPRALSGLVQLSLSDGQEDEALRYARQLVKARPGQAAYQVLLGDAYRATGDEKSARTSYQGAARLGSKTAEERLAK
jgi:CheY-like chemotaxis protein